MFNAPSNLNPIAQVQSANELVDLAAEINREHDACEAALGEGLKHARAVGDLLRRAKKQCGHGAWERWVKENCTFGPRQANKYIRLATQWDELQAAQIGTGGSDLGINRALATLTADPPRVADWGPSSILLKVRREPSQNDDAGQNGDTAEKRYTRWHDQLPDEYRVRAEALYTSVGHILYASREEWVDGFCYDAFYSRQIASWEITARAWQYVLQTHPAPARLDPKRCIGYFAWVWCGGGDPTNPEYELLHAALLRAEAEFTSDPFFVPTSVLMILAPAPHELRVALTKQVPVQATVTASSDGPALCVRVIPATGLPPEKEGRFYWLAAEAPDRDRSWKVPLPVAAWAVEQVIRDFVEETCTPDAEGQGGPYRLLSAWEEMTNFAWSHPLNPFGPPVSMEELAHWSHLPELFPPGAPATSFLQPE